MAQTRVGEAEAVQNPALGSAMIWRFGIGYQEEAANEPAPLPLAFLILPITLHSQTLDYLLSTQRRSGLSLFASKVGQSREDLLSIHIRALRFRDLSLKSIAYGIRCKLLSVDYQNARLRSNTATLPITPERIRRLLNGSERLGAWCAKLPLDQVASLLKVDF
jgi:hypothetical protein